MGRAGWLDDQLSRPARDPVIDARLASTRLRIWYEAAGQGDDGSWGALDELRPLALDTDPAELLVYIWSHGYRFLKFDAAVKLEDYPEVEMTASEQQPTLQNPNDNSNDKAAVYQWAQHLMAQGRAASGDDYHVNLLAKKMF